MSEPITLDVSNPQSATTHADRLRTGGQSVTAARAVAAPATVNRAARTAEVVWSTVARAEADRAATERIASYDPVLATARGLLPDDQNDAQRQAAIRERFCADVLRGRLWDAFAQRGRAAPPTLPANPAAGPA